MKEGRGREVKAKEKAKLKPRKPRICGHCVHYMGNLEAGFCRKLEDLEARFYGEGACNLGQKSKARRL